LESEPEDLSLADSEDSDLKPSKLEQAASSKPLNHSANGDQPTQIAFADSTKPLYSKSNFPTLTPLPSPVALSLGDLQPLPHQLLDHTQGYPHLLEDTRGFSAFSHRRKSSPTRNSKSPRLLSPSSSNGNLKHFLNKRSFTDSGHYPKTEDPTRPFACPICPKRFRMKHHLKEHNLIHSGEMPFSCHLCPKRFNRSYTLKNHMKLHSADNQDRPQDGMLAHSLMIPLLSHPPSYP